LESLLDLDELVVDEPSPLSFSFSLMDDSSDALRDSLLGEGEGTRISLPLPFLSTSIAANAAAIATANLCESTNRK
jgi:hypothetical protein